ncbi:MFS transporter [Phenylobacterium sp.]|uniref:MFS transporter n=1 Tax=Phenylobacterium sp. TaxID=1871053 RepID=UPI0025F118D9|nr:MFS transporter [Phenylobacterium sp.]
MTTTAEGVSEAATLRKISWRLLPLIALGYAIAYVDRVNISFAALQMNRDLGFSATVYGLGAGLFFLSYAALEIPSNMILAKVGARRWIARIMITWGVLAMGMAFVRTPWQFYTIRFLLGAAEAGFFPGVLYYVTLWFPETYRARAITRFYFAVPLGAALMGAVAGSLLGLQGRLGLAGWQWLFLAEGLPAVLLSGVILFCLPDGPETVSWLSTAEKAWLGERLAADAEGRAGDHHNPFRALLNPTFAALVAVNFLALGSGYAFTLSAPQIVRTATGLSADAIGYIAAGANLFGAALILTNGWLSDRTGHRGAFVAAPMVVIAAAFALMALTDAPALVIAGYVAFTAFNVAAIALFFTTPGAILHPRSAAVGVAAINSLGQLGSFVIPALWGVAKDATGTYHAGLAVVAGNVAIAAVIILVLRSRARRSALALG